MDIKLIITNLPEVGSLRAPLLKILSGAFSLTDHQVLNRVEEQIAFDLSKIATSFRPELLNYLVLYGADFSVTNGSQFLYGYAIIDANNESEEPYKWSFGFRSYAAAQIALYKAVSEIPLNRESNFAMYIMKGSSGIPLIVREDYGALVPKLIFQHFGVVDCEEPQAFEDF